jgi:hypothetical protein
MEFVIAIPSQIHPDHLDSYPRTKLDRAATQPQLSRLRAVKIDDYSGMDGYIRERLPPFEECGILLFFFDSA